MGIQSAGLSSISYVEVHRHDADMVNGEHHVKQPTPLKIFTMGRFISEIEEGKIVNTTAYYLYIAKQSKIQDKTKYPILNDPKYGTGAVVLKVLSQESPRETNSKEFTSNLKLQKLINENRLVLAYGKYGDNVQLHPSVNKFSDIRTSDLPETYKWIFLKTPSGETVPFVLLEFHSFKQKQYDCFVDTVKNFRQLSEDISRASLVNTSVAISTSSNYTPPKEKESGCVIS